MARGNWRSGKGHGPAEVGSAHRIFGGYMMKVSMRAKDEKTARSGAEYLETLGYRTNVVKGKKYWAVWRTFHKDQAKMKG